MEKTIITCDVCNTEINICKDRYWRLASHDDPDGDIYGMVVTYICDKCHPGMDEFIDYLKTTI